jgi:plasmid stabilization system protein ParE
MKLRFTPRAIHDLAEIGDYVAEHSSSAAQRVRAAIIDSLKRLTAFPESGRRQTVEDVRKIVTRKYPYLVYYTIDEPADEVVVLAIQHPSREREFDDL